MILHHLLEREPYVPKRPARGWEGRIWDPSDPQEVDASSGPPREVKPLPVETERRLRRIVSRLPAGSTTSRPGPRGRG